MIAWRFILPASVCLAEALILSDFYSHLLTRRIKPVPRYYLLLLLMYAPLLAINLLANPLLNLLASLLLSFGIAFTLFEGQRTRQSYYALLWLVGMAITEFLAACLVNVNFYILDAFQEIPADVYFCAILAKMLLLVYCKICVSFLERSQSNLPLKYFIGFFMLPVFSLLIINVLLVLSHDQISAGTTGLLVLLAVSLIFINIIFSTFFERALINEAKAKENVQLQYRSVINEQYLKLLQDKYEAVQIYQHDFGKHLQIMRGLADASQHQAVVDYIDQVADHMNHAQMIRHTGTQVLDILLTNKIAQADHAGVQLILDLHPVNFAFIADNDLGSIMSNILDNALEASSQSLAKWIKLTIKMKNSHYIIMTLVNSCDQESSMHHGQMQSRKQEPGHGYGLKSVRKTLDAYDGDFVYDYDCLSKAFTINVLLPLENSRGRS